MKRLIAKLSLFLFSIIILNFLYIRTNYWKCENDVNKFSEVPYNIVLGNLGSSHGNYGFKFDTSPEINAWNFALNSQPYFYDYKVLNKYIEHFDNNAIILILISYFGITGRSDYSAYRGRYYRFLTKEEMDFWSLKEYIAYAKFPILSAKKNILRILYDKRKEQMTPYYNRTTSMNNYDIERNCIEKHKNWTSSGKNGYKLNISEVSAIIELCYSHNLIPVLISTPITDVLNKIYEQDGDFFPTFEQFTTDLCNKYPNLLYLDYSRSEEFSHNHELFEDGDHLNNFGAEKFTKTVVNELRSRDLLKK